jgi:hypothetical protein
MARYMQQLNSVYEKMITAMTINMYASNPLAAAAQAPQQPVAPQQPAQPQQPANAQPAAPANFQTAVPPAYHGNGSAPENA